MSPSFQPASTLSPAHAFASHLRPPAICTWAAPVPRCSTGCSPAITAARWSCALKTPISSARRRRWSKAFCRACAGSASTGTKAPTIRPSAWKCIARARPSCWPPDMPTTVSAARQELEQRRAAATAEGRPPRYEGTCRKISREEGARRRAAGEAAAVRFAMPESGSDRLRRRRLRPCGVCQHRTGRLCAAALRRRAHLSPERGHRRRGHAHQPHHPRRRSYFEYAKTSFALPGAGRALAGVRPRAADPRTGQDAPEQAPRRHQRDRLSRRRHRARSVPQFSGAAGMDPARIRSGRRFHGNPGRPATDRAAST